MAPQVRHIATHAASTAAASKDAAIYLAIDDGGTHLLPTVCLVATIPLATIRIMALRLIK
jgi:hypothetical protein